MPNVKNYLLDPEHGNFVITTDACCDLLPIELSTFGIWPHVAPCHVTVDGEEIDISDVDEFYRKVAKREYRPGHIKTAGTSPAEALEMLEDVIRNTPEHVAIVHVSTSTHISSTTHSNTYLATLELQEKYPNRTIEFVDSHSVSNGQALFLEYLAGYEGNTLDDLLDYADKLAHHVAHLFTLNSLVYAFESGRFGHKSKLVGKIASILVHPFMFFPYDGELAIGPKIRAPLIVREWVAYFNAHSEADTIIRFGYGDQESLKLVERTVEKLTTLGVPADRIQIAHVSPIIGAHCGEGVVSWFFLSRTPRPKDGSEFAKD